jgi:hypothetical protein
MTETKKMGRPPMKGEKMSKAEYQRRYRAKKKAEQKHEAYLSMEQQDLQAFTNLASSFNTTRNQLIGGLLRGAMVQLQGLDKALSPIEELHPEQVALYKHQALRLMAEGGNLEHLILKIADDRTQAIESHLSCASEGDSNAR